MPLCSTSTILSGHPNCRRTVVNKYAYSPYGRLLGQVQGISQPFKYAGQVGIFAESDTLLYMRARYYDVEVGRFISEDPAGFIDGTNLYAYVGGNPVNAVDPTGQFLMFVPGIVGGVANVAVTAAFGDTDVASLGTAFLAGALGAYVPGGAAALAVKQSAKIGLKLSGGAVAGAGANAAGQVVNNLQAGRSAGEIDYTQVGVAAVGGFLGTASTLGAGTRAVETVTAGIFGTKFGLASGAANKIISGK